MLLILCIPGSAHGQGAGAAFRDSSHARIVYQDSASMLRISGVYRNGGDTAVSYGYELTAVKLGSSHSRSSQSGRFSCAPHTDITLSKTTINAAAGHRVTVSLLIRDGATVVARDSLTLR